VDYIQYEEHGDGVVVMRLNRPERLNALGYELKTEFRHEALPRFRDDPAARVLILTGVGRAFCSGRDMKETRAGTLDSWSDSEGPPSIREFEEFEKPVICAINGIAAGGGLQLALTCDVVIASERAQLGWVQLKAGLIAPWYNGLTNNVPWPPIADMLLTGDMVSARRAYEIGLVSRVVPHEELDATALEMARKIAAMPAEELRYTIRFLHKAKDRPSPELIAESRAAYRATDPSARAARELGLASIPGGAAAGTT
jgi:enoyl-CoA hydratase/carnithine racemase